MVKDKEVQNLAEMICDCLDCDKCFAERMCVKGHGKANGMYKYLKEWVDGYRKTTEIPRES